MYTLVFLLFNFFHKPITLVSLWILSVFVGCNSNYHIVSKLMIVDSLDIVPIYLQTLVCVFIFYLLTKTHVSSSSRSLFVGIKLESEGSFYTIPILPLFL